MSTMFHFERAVMARKPHTCDQCGRRIAKGSRYLRIAGRFDGVFCYSKEHGDCRDAWEAFRRYKEYSHWDGAPFLMDDDFYPEDKEWMAKRFPAVALRFGWYMPS